jgi:hypothetical protein
MKLDDLKSKIYEMIKDRFELENDGSLKNELLSLVDEDPQYKEIIRIRRLGIQVENWKTLVLIEIEADNEIEIKVELKNAITWLALIKETLLGAENTDLYLFLAFSSEVSVEECLRIESTEQFCRKYVLLPDEDVSEFVNRTFLQKLVDRTDTIEGKDPLERAFSKTAEKYNWLTSEKQKQWRSAFSDLYGSDLADELLKEEENV